MSIPERSFIVSSSKLELVTPRETCLLTVRSTYDITVLTLIPFEQNILYISTISSANVWYPWKKIG